MVQSNMESSTQHNLMPSPPVVMNKGPLSYNYTLDHMIIHYGRDNKRGSEHSIDGYAFPAEIQLFFFNSQLYPNWSDASSRPHGVAALSILIQLSNFEHPHENSQLKLASDTLRTGVSKSDPSKSASVTSSKKSLNLMNFSINDLLPAKSSSSFRSFITYEGSLTQPSCSENVDWILLNKPLYISGHNLNQMRNTIAGFGDNFRPIQPTLTRCIRTNIDYGNAGSGDGTKGSKEYKSCSMNKIFTYKSIQRPSASTGSGGRGSSNL